MPTTTNYGWTTPADTDLVKDGASAIRTLGTSIDTTTKNLNPSTTLGDIEYRSSTANTNTRLAIGTSGQVLAVSGGVPAWTTPASGSTFTGVQVTKANSQTISNNTATALTFDLETFDTDSFHSTVTNTSRITIPSGKGGKYLVNTSILYQQSGSTGFRQLQIYKNGSLYTMNITPATNACDNQVTKSIVMDLVATDYIELYARHTSGGNAAAAGDDTTFAVTFFEAYLIGA
jgi:predicted flavoprotein YhiN